MLFKLQFLTLIVVVSSVRDLSIAEKKLKIKEVRKPISIFEAPFVVAIFVFGKFQCSGALFTPETVLAPASCLQIYDNHRFQYEPPRSIIVGFASTYLENQCRVPVQQLFIHPNYNADILDFNIAVLRLKYRIKSYHGVPQYVRLRRQKTPVPVNVHLMAFGWNLNEAHFDESGKNEHKSYLMDRGNYEIHEKDYKHQMHATLMSVVPSSECLERQPISPHAKRHMTNNMFCATDNVTMGVANLYLRYDIGSPAIAHSQLFGLHSHSALLRGHAVVKNPAYFVNIGVVNAWIQHLVAGFPKKRTKKRIQMSDNCGDIKVVQEDCSDEEDDDSEEDNGSDDKCTNCLDDVLSCEVLKLDPNFKPAPNCGNKQARCEDPIASDEAVIDFDNAITFNQTFLTIFDNDPCVNGPAPTPIKYVKVKAENCKEKKRLRKLLRKKAKLAAGTTPHPKMLISRVNEKGEVEMVPAVKINGTLIPSRFKLKNQTEESSCEKFDEATTTVKQCVDEVEVNPECEVQTTKRPDKVEVNPECEVTTFRPDKVEVNPECEFKPTNRPDKVEVNPECEVKTTNRPDKVEVHPECEVTTCRPDKVEFNPECEVKTTNRPDEVEVNPECEVTTCRPDKAEVNPECEVKPTNRPDKVDVNPECEVTTYRPDKIEVNPECEVQTTSRPDKVEVNPECEVTTCRPRPDKIEVNPECEVQTTKRPDKVEVNPECEVTTPKLEVNNDCTTTEKPCKLRPVVDAPCGPLITTPRDRIEERGAATQQSNADPHDFQHNKKDDSHTTEYFTLPDRDKTRRDFILKRRLDPQRNFKTKFQFGTKVEKNVAYIDDNMLGLSENKRKYVPKSFTDVVIYQPLEDDVVRLGRTVPYTYD